MKTNESTCLLSGDLALLPYKRWMVPKYHGWMKDEELRRLTGSEPLSLQEEYDMQDSWHKDPDKLTFIVFAKSPSSSSSSTKSSEPEDWIQIGDVNMFIAPNFEPDSEDVIGELEIMIAEPKFRRRGYARQCLQIMAKYSRDHCKIDQFKAHVVEDNVGSTKLFLGLGFKEIEFQDWSKEYIYGMKAEDLEKLMGKMNSIEVVEYGTMLKKFGTQIEGYNENEEEEVLDEGSDDEGNSKKKVECTEGDQKDGGEETLSEGT